MTDTQTARFAGSNPDRQTLGLPGHCEECAAYGHSVAHPKLGCADVGCDREHKPAQRERQYPADDTCHGRCAALRDWFAYETRGLMDPDESHNVLDMLLNRLATEEATR